ncbi:contact-dependent growth inhibition system immunity protein [Pseudomonas sp. TE24901]
MNSHLTELQQFLGAYFNQDWTEEYSTADEAIDSFLRESPIDIITTVKEEIIKLKNSHTNEKELKNNLLHEQYCHYRYLHEWASGKLWLDHVIKKLDKHLFQAKNQ